MNKRYFGGFESYDGMVGAFMNGGYDYVKGESRKIDLPADFPSDEQVMFAAYEGASYEGDAMVIFRSEDGQLKIVSGSHCSCYGLEGQWDPTTTTDNALSMMKLSDRDYCAETVSAFNEMFHKKGNE